MKSLIRFALPLLPLLLTAWAHALPNEVTYDISARLDAERNLLAGTARVAVTNRAAEPFHALYFHVVPNAFARGADTAYQRDLAAVGAGLEQVYAGADDAALRVERVALDGRALPFEIDGTILRVSLPEPLPPEQTTTLAIDFVNDLVEAGAQHRFAGTLAVRSGVRDGVYTLAKWYPQLAVYDSDGWNLDPYRLIGEFYGDFGDYQLALTVPADVVVGASGELVETAEAPEGARTWTFRARRVRDVAWSASARYQVEERSWEGKTVRALALDRPLAELALDSLKFFSGAFGPYAYDTLTVAQATVGGGMEYPGIVMIASGSVEEVSHEVAHQWWYAGVGNDEFDEPWLDEGPATFASELYRVSARGEPPGIRRMLDFQEPGVPVLSTSQAFPSIRQFVAAVYTKGSALFWMLDDLLGRETLLRAFSTYYERFKYRNATTRDLIAVFDDVSGRKLDWFFDQWLRTTAVLDAAVGEVRAVERAGRVETTIELLHRGGARMPVAVSIADGSGRSETVRWDGEADRVALTVTTDAPLTRVVLDPERTLLEPDRSNNTWSGPRAAAAPWPLWGGLALAGVALFWLRRLH